MTEWTQASLERKIKELEQTIVNLQSQVDWLKKEQQKVKNGDVWRK